MIELLAIIVTHPYLTFIGSCVYCISTAFIMKSLRKSYQSSRGITDILLYASKALGIHDSMKYLSDTMITLQLLYVMVHMYIYNSYLFPVYISISTVSQLIRGTCTLLTSLPPLKCYDDKIRFLGINGTGTEYIFSGHASYTCLCYIYILTFTGLPVIPVTLYTVISQIAIIASHNHYSIDVALAWVIIPLLKQYIELRYY